MHILNDLGRHQEALEAGQIILDASSGQSEMPPQAKIMIAIAYSNQGVCYETMGRYEEALEAYGIAEARLTELEMIEYIGDVSNNRGIVLMYLGRISEALSAFEKASQITADAGLTLLQAQILNNLGEAHLIQGTYTHTLKAFEQARQLFENLDAQANLGILLQKMADAYRALNLYPEALALYQEAGELTGQAGMADHHARTLLGMGATLIAQRRFGEAGPVLAEAASLFEEANHLPLLSSDSAGTEAC
jgi:tetratricopeptide (TPR) repeat protein